MRCACGIKRESEQGLAGGMGEMTRETVDITSKIGKAEKMESGLNTTLLTGRRRKSTCVQETS